MKRTKCPLYDFCVQPINCPDGFCKEDGCKSPPRLADRVSTTYFSTRATRARQARRDRSIGLLGMLGCAASFVAYCYIVWRIFTP